MDERKDRYNEQESEGRLQGSKSDPQKTEMEGLKQGGKEPIVHSDDKAKDEEGKTDD